MKGMVAVGVAVVAAAVGASAALAHWAPDTPSILTRAIHFEYRAWDGRLRPGWLLLPLNYAGQAIPLVISPHGRGLAAGDNALRWGDLPGEGDFAVVCPGGEGRRLHNYSWGYEGQIADLARMPEIVQRLGVHVDRKRIYAIGGSMGGQETLLLVARYPHLLAGAVAFDPDTNMALRYYDFAQLKDGAALQALAREEIGGTPAQVPEAYALRSPEHYVRQIAESDVPLQIYWSTRDRIIRDQRREAGLLAIQVRDDHPDAPVWDFEGQWAHTAEMQPDRRLPRALARFGLLPPSDIPSVSKPAPGSFV